MKTIRWCVLGVIIFVVLNSAQATLYQDKVCASFSGGAFGAIVDSGGVIRPQVALGTQMLHQPDSDGGFWPASAGDWSNPSSTGCPDSRTAAQVQGTFASSDGWYDYETTFYTQSVSAGVRNSDGSCRVWVEEWTTRTE